MAVLNPLLSSDPGWRCYQEHGLGSSVVAIGVTRDAYGEGSANKGIWRRCQQRRGIVKEKEAARRKCY